MSAVEWTVAGGLAGWAAARLAGADRWRYVEAWAVPVLSFTPQATAGAWAGALLIRGRGARITAALAGAALTAAMASRALPRRQPPASGPVLRLLTANLREGRAAAAPLVALARRTGADVLFVQELTDAAAARLQRAGLSVLLPHHITQAAPADAGGGGIYARHPLRDGLAVASAAMAQPAARLDLPSEQSVQLVCVHPPPPKRPWSRGAVARWRAELSMLPPPGDTPVILAGDFNATLDHAQLRRLLRLGHQDAARQAGNALVPTWRPEPCGCPALLAIDHILIDPRCAVRATSAHPLPGSDHRAPGSACPRRQTAPPRSQPEPVLRRHSSPAGRTASEKGACREIRSVLADNGRRIAAVTRQVGGPGRIESFGSGDGPRLLDRYRQAWRKEGSPAASDLGLTANFGSTGSGRAWRRLALGASVVAISWHEMPQSLTQTPSMHTRSRACAQGWRFGVAS